MNKKIIWTIVIVVILVAARIIILNLPQKPAISPVAGPGEETVPVVVPEGTPAAPELNLSQIKEPEAVAPGASPVSREGEVLAPSGELAENVAPIGSTGAPQPSNVLEEKEVPKDALILTATREKGFEPKVFSAKAGQVVTIVLVSGDNQNHGFSFSDPILGAVTMNVGAGERKAITFKAPTSLGEYEFCCNIPSHRRAGECGKMFVAE